LVILFFLYLQLCGEERFSAIKKIVGILQILSTIDLFSPTELTPWIHLTIYSAQRLDLFAWCVRLSQLSLGFRTHFKSTQFHSFIHSF